MSLRAAEKRVGARLATALAVCLAASCEGVPGVMHDLSGYVRDAVTGAPLSGATVTFRTDTLRAWDTTSDGSGLYRMLVDVDVSFGEVSATKDGYDRVESTVFFDTDARRVDLPMQKVL